MKKILLVLLTVSLLLTACLDKSSSEVVEGNTIVVKEEVATTKESQAVTEFSYVGDGSLPIIEIDSERFFDFTSDEFLKNLNAKSIEILGEPSTFRQDSQPEQGYVSFIGDNGMICVVGIDDNTNKVTEVMVMGQSSDFSLSELAVETIPVVMLLNPNMEASYAGAHLVDIALAAQIRFGQSQFAYEGEHDGIQELIYGEEDFIIFYFAPVMDEKEESN